MWQLQRVCIFLLAFANTGNAAKTQLRRDLADSDKAPAKNDIGRIRGGFTLVDSFSWLGVFDDTIVCGAVLVHGDIALTTANCVDEALPQALRFGSVNRTSGGTVAKVLRGVIHPDYNGDPTGGADIAVLQLDNVLTNTVAIINEDPSVPFDGSDSLFMAGWGLINDTAFAMSLQGLFLQNIENCFARAPPVYNPVFHFCGDASPTAGTCPGDSGIPILVPGTRLAVGLNSFSDRPCETQTIDVYTRLSSYSIWIKKMVCDMSADPPAACAEYAKDICLFNEIFSWVSGIFGF